MNEGDNEDKYENPSYQIPLVSRVVKRESKVYKKSFIAIVIIFPPVLFLIWTLGWEVMGMGTVSGSRSIVGPLIYTTVLVVMLVLSFLSPEG